MRLSVVQKQCCHPLYCNWATKEATATSSLPPPASYWYSFFHSIINPNKLSKN